MDVQVQKSQVNECREILAQQMLLGKDDVAGGVRQL